MDVQRNWRRSAPDNTHAALSVVTHAPIVVNLVSTWVTKLKKPAQSKTCLEKASGMSCHRNGRRKCKESTSGGLSMMLRTMCMAGCGGDRGNTWRMTK
eukprot:10785178-Alexandrium_andersonii.AAC.1